MKKLINGVQVDMCPKELAEFNVSRCKDNYVRYATKDKVTNMSKMDKKEFKVLKEEIKQLKKEAQDNMNNSNDKAKEAKALVAVAQYEVKEIKEAVKQIKKEILKELEVAIPKVPEVEEVKPIINNIERKEDMNKIKELIVNNKMAAVAIAAGVGILVFGIIVNLAT